MLTIDTIRSTEYGDRSPAIKNVIFCLLTKAFNPSASLVLVRLENAIATDFPVVHFRNNYYNYYSGYTAEHPEYLIYQDGSWPSSENPRKVFPKPVVKDMRTIQVEFLQSRLGFFDINHVVTMYEEIRKNQSKHLHYA